jgi:bacterial/archaeal transporter family-2 protein
VATWAYLAFGFAAGAMLPLQFGIDAQLARWVESPVRASLVSFAVGSLVLLLAALPLLRGWPAASALEEAPWWVWIGGSLGAFYVQRSIVAAPRLGAVTLIGLILAGQAVASLLVEPLRLGGVRGAPGHAGAPRRHRASRRRRDPRADHLT